MINHQPSDADVKRPPCPRRPCLTHKSSTRSPVTFTWTRQAIPHNMVRRASARRPRWGHPRVRRRQLFWRRPNSVLGVHYPPSSPDRVVRDCQGVPDFVRPSQVFSDGILEQRPQRVESVLVSLVPYCQHVPDRTVIALDSLRRATTRDARRASAATTERYTAVTWSCRESNPLHGVDGVNTIRWPMGRCRRPAPRLISFSGHGSLRG